MIDNCLRKVIDSKDNIFTIPNFCINEPLFLKEFDKMKENDIKEDMLSVLIEFT